MIKALPVIIIFSINLYSQSTGQKSNIEQTAENIYTGISESVSWLDLPVLALMFSKKALHSPDHSKIISIAPFIFDEDIKRSIGLNGNDSPGSMDQNTIPNIILLSRIVYTTTANLISPQSVTKNDYKHLILFYKTMVYTHTFTELSKNLVKRDRPDGSDTRSFFSGHTSATFAAASFLYLELNSFYNDWLFTKNDDLLRIGFKAASFSILYGWAGYVGYCRMKDNKHYLSDVLLGAAFGTGISHLIYNFYLGDEEENLILNNFTINVINKSPTLSLSLHF